jgi:hypothetical protein
VRFRSLFLMAVVLALLVGTVTYPAAADVRSDVDEGARISRSPAIARTFEGPTAAIDPRDPEKIYVAAADLLANRCHIFRSGDGGRSFGELKGPDFGRFTDCGLNKGGIPQNIRMKLAFDQEGVLYWVVAVADPAAQGSRNVVLARSRDDGRTWATTTVAEAPAPPRAEDAAANFVPDLFVDPFGRAPRTVWVSWRRSFTEVSERTTEGWAARSTDGGATFGPELRAIEKNPGFDAPRVLQDRDGTVYWFQRERPPEGAEGEAPKPSPLLMARSDDGGQTWVPGELGPSDAVMEEPLAAVSPEGDTLYVAWADGRNGDLDLFFIRSVDGGRNWSEPLRVNDDRLRNRRSQKWPRMSIAPNGRIDLAWYDYRHDSKDVPEDDVEFFLGDVNDVYSASSDDRGTSFSENVRVTQESVDRRIGTYNTQYFVEVPPGLGSGRRHLYIAWSDTRLGNERTSAQDIFGARASVSSGGGISWRAVVIAAEVALLLVGIALLTGAVVLRRRARRQPVPMEPLP